MRDRIKILVIDDSNLIRFKIKGAFEEYDIEILELNNAEDFFRFSKRFQKVNLIILDVNLPDMNGIEALERMHMNSEWSYIPVIMLTGKADRVTVEKALRAGAVNYIRKPFTDDEVLERVEKILGVLPLKGDDENTWSYDRIEKQIDDEIERAKRGNYTFSLVKINSPGVVENTSDLDKLVKLKDNIVKELRTIDMSFISPKLDLILFLPFTNTEGAALVVNKICEKHINGENIKVESSIAAFPDNCKNSEEILDKLSI